MAGLVVMLLAACMPNASSSSAVLPLADNQPTLLFFYTDG
jgi:hypothetical protein